MSEVVEQSTSVWIDDESNPLNARVAGDPRVWALTGYFRDETGRPTGRYLDDAARDYHLPREAVEAAFAYYRRHQSVIDARADANAA